MRDSVNLSQRGIVIASLLLSLRRASFVGVVSFLLALPALAQNSGAASAAAAPALSRTVAVPEHHRCDDNCRHTHGQSGDSAYVYIPGLPDRYRNFQFVDPAVPVDGYKVPCDVNSVEGALFREVPRPETDTLPTEAAFLQVNPVEFSLQLDGFPVAAERPFCLPLSPTRTVRVWVKRFKVLEEDARVVAADGETELPYSPDPALFLSGMVAGEPRSFVYLAVFSGYVSGYVDLPEEQGRPARRYMIAPLGEPSQQTSTVIVYDETLVDLPQRPGVAETGCSSELLDDYDERVQESLTNRGAQQKGSKDRLNSSDILVASIAIDCDSQFYADHGSNLSRSVNYARTVMGAVSAVYTRDVNVRLRVPYLRVWRSGDPYDDTDATEMLFDMRPHWNTNMRDVNRSLAHLFSGRNGIGGVAWVNVLCSSLLSGYGYGVSGLNNNVSYPTTSYVWDTDVTAHELGHNFGSSHTHNCNWNPAIDSCWTAEGGCFPTRIDRRGTIMSYCHLQPSGKGLYLHPIVSTLIRFRCENGACVYREEESAAKDVAVMDITLPAPGASVEDDTWFVPEAVVKNVGTDDQTDLVVTFTIEEFDGTDVWSTTANVDLDAGEVKHVTFASTSLATLGDYFSRVDIALTGDSKTVNNELKQPFAVVGSFSGTLELTSHNKDTTYVSGSTSKIEWDRTVISTVMIEFSPDDGASWYSVRTNQTASTEQYNWTVPAINTDLGRLRIYDRNNAGLIDVSDTAFSITVNNDIEVREILFPTPGGDDTASFVPRVEIRNNGSNAVKNLPVTFRMVSQPLRAEVFSTSGTIPLISANSIDTVDFPEASVAVNSRYIMYARAFLASDTDNSNDSAARYNDVIAPTLALQTPNGGESWQVGARKTIQWSNAVGNISAIRLDYSENGGVNWHKIERATANTGSYSWRVPDVPGSSLRVRAADSRHPIVFDNSNFNFAVVPIPAPINVNVYTDGDSVRIEWQDAGVEDLDAFRIYRGTSPGSLSEIASVGPTNISYAHGLLTFGQKYYYDVRAVAGPYESDAATPIEYCRFFVTVTPEGPTTFCADDSVVLDAGAGHLNYLWSNGALTQKITVNQSGQYSVSVTALGGCTAEATSPTITVFELPVVNINADGPTSFCSGGSVTLDAGEGWTSVLWSNGLTTPEITVSEGGLYSVTATNANGCSDTDSINITVFDNPDPLVVADGPTSFCADSDVTLDVGDTFTSVLWSNGSTSNSISVNQSGVYTSIVTNANGCSATTSISVTVFNLPEPVITPDGPTTFCADESVTLDLGESFASILWSNGSTLNSININQSGIYSATVTNANGCSATTSISVTVFNLPEPVITPDGPTTFCADESVTLDLGESFASILWSNGSTLNSININQSGIYSATVTNANGCSATTSISVTVFNLPEPIIAADGPTNFCADSDVTLDVGVLFASVLWSSGSTDNSITVNQSGLYTATVTNANGCSASTSISVTVFNLPEPVIAADGPTTFCADEDVTLDVGDTFTSVLWSNGLTSNNITVNQSGVYSATVTNADGCSASTSISVTVFDLPEPAIAADGPTSFCADEDVTLDVGQSFESVLWSNGATASSIVVNQTGIYTATVANADGCSAATSISVTVFELPQPMITPDGPTEFCADEDVTLDVGDSFTAVLWSNGATTSSIVVNQSGIFEATVTNANGCSASTSIAVTVFKLPQPEITPDGPTTFCADEDVTLDLGPSFNSVLWSNGATTTAITVNQSGVYTATVANIDGCSATTSISVTVFELPEPTITTDGPTEFCAGEDLTLDVGNSFASVLWSNGATTTAITVNQSGTYSAIVTTANGCSASTSISVTVFELPQPTITPDGPTEFCADENVTLDVGQSFESVLWSNGATTHSITVNRSGLFTVTVVNANGCAASSSVSVTVFELPAPTITTDGPTEFCADEDLTLDVGNSFASVLWSNGATTASITVNQTGVYSATVTTANGCTASTSISVTVFELPAPTITTDGPTEFCANEDVTLDVGDSFASVLWSNGATTNAITVNQSGLFTATVVNTNDCVASTSVSVTVFDLPEPTITPDGPTEFCAGDDVTIDVGNSYASVLWSNGLTTPAISVDTGGIYTAIVTTANGCTAATSITITVYDLPAPMISPDGPTEFCADEDVTLDVGDSFASVLWSNGATTNAIAVNQSGVYTATVFNDSGCQASSSMTVTVFNLPEPTITPNGPTEFCDGRSVKLDVGNTWASILWSDGSTNRAITVRETGLYTATVATLDGCTASTSISVTVYSAPDPQISADGPTEFCAGGDVTLDVGDNWAEVLWSTGSLDNSITVNESGVYSALVSTAFGCSEATTVTVTVFDNPSPQITADGPTTICPKDDVTLDVGDNWAEVLWSNGATDASITVNTSGVYSALVTNANGCSASTSITVTLRLSPTPRITADGPTAFCQGEDVTLDVGGEWSAVQWSNGATASNITVNQSGTFEATVTNDEGCSAGTSITVTVFNLPQPTIAPDGPTEFCLGDDVTLDLGEQYTNILWSNGATTSNITVNQSGIFEVTVTNNNGCSASTSIVVTVFNLPQPTITPDGPTAFCLGEDVTLDLGEQYTNILWSNGATTSNITVNQSGIFAATVTNSNGCSASTSIAVTVFNLPQPNISADGPTEFCQGEDVTLDVGDEFSSIQWSNGATSSSIVVNQSGIFEVTVTNNNGCSASTSISITVNSLPTAQITSGGVTEICEDETLLLDAGPGFSAYLWSNGATTQTINVQQALSGVTSAVLTFSVTVANAQLCQSRASIELTIHALPQTTVTSDGPTTLCPGEDVTLFAPAGYDAYEWSDGTLGRTITLNSTAAVYCTITSDFGCEATTEIVEIRLNTFLQPRIATDGSTDFCAGETRLLDAGWGFTSYLWNNGATSQTIIVDASGTYSVMVTNANNCSGSTSISLTRHDLPVAAIVNSGPVEFCEGEDVELDAGDGFASYMWNTGETTQTIVAAQSGVYRVTVANVHGCTQSSAVTVTVYALPQPNIHADGPTEFCAGGDVRLSIGSQYPFILWNNGATSPSITVAASGVYHVTVGTIHGCRQSTSITVTVNELPAPQITADGPLEFCGGQSVELDAGSGFAAYLWSNGATSQTIVVASSGTYRVTVATIHGCDADDQVTVTVNAIHLSIDLLLEGAYDGGAMRTDLRDNGLLPTEQPFGGAPHNYGGTEAIGFAAAQISDWILVELRDPDDATTVLLRRAALLDREGIVRDHDGTNGILLPADFGFDSVLVVVHMPSHLSIMSAAALIRSEDCRAEIDFRAAGAAFRDFQDPTLELEPDLYGAFGGDVTQDGFINARDRVEVRRHSFEVGYLPWDANRDGVVTSLDRVIVRNNSFRISQVP